MEPALELVSKRTKRETPATVPNVIPFETPTPMMLLSMAVQQGADLDKLSKLMDLQERWEANEARRAFVQALTAFKSNPPRLEKNRTVSYQTSKGVTCYKHATLDHVAEVLGMELSKHGLSFRWTIHQEEKRIAVTCILQHALGHSETVTMSGPLDESGQKNALQQAGSSVTYLQRYTLLAATGMSTSEDTDATPKTEAVSELTTDQLGRYIAQIQKATDMPALSQAFNSAYQSSRNQDDRTAIIEAKNQRQRELTRG